MSDDIKKGVNKSKILIRVIGALAIVVILCVIILAILSLLSPKNRYFRLVNHFLTDVSSTVNKVNKMPIGKIMDIDTASKLDVDVLFKGDIKTDNYAVKEWLQNLDSFEMKVKENVDLANDYSYLDTKFLINGSDFLSGNLVQNGEMVSVNVPTITDGYVTVNNNKLSELWEKVGYNGPNTLTSHLDLIKGLTFSDDEKKTFLDALEKSFSTFACNFSDEDFIGGIGSVKYDEGVIECNYIDFNMDAHRLNSAVVAVLEELRSKEKYMDLLHKMVTLLNEIYGETPFTKAEFLVVYEGLLEEIRAIDSTELEDRVIRLYYKGNDVIKIEILSADYNSRYFQFTMIDNENSGYYMYQNDVKIYEDKVTVIDDITTHILNMDYINYETGEVHEGYGSEIVITIDNSSENLQNINFVEKKRLLDYSEGENDIMLVEPSIIKEHTFSIEALEDVNKLIITMKENDNGFYNAFDIEMNIKENAEFEHFKVKDDFIVDSKTDAEIYSKKREIESKWNKYSLSNFNRIQQFQTAMSLYLGAFFTMDYSEDFI